MRGVHHPHHLPCIRGCEKFGEGELPPLLHARRGRAQRRREVEAVQITGRVGLSAGEGHDGCRDVNVPKMENV